MHPPDDVSGCGSRASFPGLFGIFGGLPSEFFRPHDAISGQAFLGFDAWISNLPAGLRGLLVLAAQHVEWLERGMPACRAGRDASSFGAFNRRLISGALAPGGA